MPGPLLGEGIPKIELYNNVHLAIPFPNLDGYCHLLPQKNNGTVR